MSNLSDDTLRKVGRYLPTAASRADLFPRYYNRYRTRFAGRANNTCQRLICDIGCNISESPGYNAVTAAIEGEREEDTGVDSQRVGNYTAEWEDVQGGWKDVRFSASSQTSVSLTFHGHQAPISEGTRAYSSFSIGSFSKAEPMSTKRMLHNRRP
jgi:hypothetical protein